MPVLVVFPSKAFDMIFACLNRALFGTFVLVCEHVGFQVLEYFAAVWICATAFFPVLFAAEVGLAALRLTRGYGWWWIRIGIVT